MQVEDESVREKRQPSAASRLACLILVLAGALLSLGGCTQALARNDAGGEGGASLEARSGATRETREVTPETRNVRAAPQGGQKTAAPVPSPVGIQISYRLDPWLVSGNYGAGFWGSPAVLAMERCSGARPDRA